MQSSLFQFLIYDNENGFFVKQKKNEKKKLIKINQCSKCFFRVLQLTRLVEFISRSLLRWYLTASNSIEPPTKFKNRHYTLYYYFFLSSFTVHFYYQSNNYKLRVLNLSPGFSLFLSFHFSPSLSPFLIFALIG